MHTFARVRIFFGSRHAYRCINTVTNATQINTNATPKSGLIKAYEYNYHFHVVNPTSTFIANNAVVSPAKDVFLYFLNN